MNKKIDILERKPKINDWILVMNPYENDDYGIDFLSEIKTEDGNEVCYGKFGTRCLLCDVKTIIISEPLFKGKRYLTGLHDIKDQELKEGDIFYDINRPTHYYRVWRVKGGFVCNTNVEMWQKEIELDIPPIVTMPLADRQTQSWFEGSCKIINDVNELMKIKNE